MIQCDIVEKELASKHNINVYDFMILSFLN